MKKQNSQVITFPKTPVTGPPPGGASKPAEYVIVALSTNICMALAIAVAITSTCEICVELGAGRLARNADLNAFFSVIVSNGITYN